jgi:hypothetical protein
MWMRRVFLNFSVRQYLKMNEKINSFFLRAYFHFLQRKFNLATGSFQSQSHNFQNCVLYYNVLLFSFFFNGARWCCSAYQIISLVTLSVILCGLLN